MLTPAGRDRLADVLLSGSGDLAEALNGILVLPSGPGVRLLVSALSRIKEERDAFLESAARFDESAGEAGSGDPDRVVLCCGQVIAYSHAADRITEALVEVFDLWKQYEERALPGDSFHDRAVERSMRIRGPRKSP